MSLADWLANGWLLRFELYEAHNTISQEEADALLDAVEELMRLVRQSFTL